MSDNLHDAPAVDVSRPLAPDCSGFLALSDWCHRDIDEAVLAYGPTCDDIAGPGDPSNGVRLSPDADDTHEAYSWWEVRRLIEWGPGREYSGDCDGSGA